MEATVSQSLHLSKWTYAEKTATMSSRSLGFSPSIRQKQRFQVLISSHYETKKAVTCHRPLELKVSCTRTVPALTLESESFPATCEEDVRLKHKSEEIEADLDGRCIYLIGMMGSGKTTVGRVLSDVLGYSFFDSDKLIEQAVGGTPVADIFKLYGESFFRNNETDVLRKLSSMHRLVVSTGGGVVIRPINWKYMQKGISVWLDVPLEALARRIAKEGTHSRPLVHQELGDAYESTLARLSTLWVERSEAYINNANARVSLENIAAKMGYGDVCSITPHEIAYEALLQIEAFLKK